MSGTHHQLLYHLVFSTKQRKPYLTLDLRFEMFNYLEGAIRDLKGVVFEIGGWVDHVHILAKLTASHRLSDFMREIKCNSSKHFNDQHRSINKIGWQDGYGAFTVSKSQVPAVVRYIQNQESHHAKHSFEDEYRQMLLVNEIEFDERYLWD